jgi:hypothetical protein
LETIQLIVKKFKVFARHYAALRLRGAQVTAKEVWSVADTIVEAPRQFELAFSKPEDLDWLENDLRENGRTWLRRHEAMVVNHLKAHGRQIPWWTERAVC